MSDTVSPSDAFDALCNADARRILALASEEPMTAEELAEQCDVSRSTVYRHANVLVDRGFLEEELRLDPEGNHQRAFAAHLHRFGVTVRDGEMEVDFAFRPDYFDRFDRFWRDLGDLGDGNDRDG